MVMVVMAMLEVEEGEGGGYGGGGADGSGRVGLDRDDGSEVMVGKVEMMIMVTWR